MANVKISDLTAASVAAAANEFEINEAGTSKKVTGTQISAFVKADLLDDTTVNFTGTLQNGGSNVIVDTDIDSTVIGYVAPGTSGNILTSNGSAWTSAAPAASGGFDAGTRMMFAQTAAPTGWTKDTTNYNNHSLRVVTGTASTGGTVDFTTAFASQTPTGSVTITSVTGTAGATTLTTPQIPSHTHGYAAGNTGKNFAVGPQDGVGNFQPSKTTTSTGASGSHNHPFSFTSGAGTFSGSAIDLAVKYLDVITATKDA